MSDAGFWKGALLPDRRLLARSGQKVFLSADALGLLGDLLRARRASAVARPRAKKITQKSQGIRR